MEPFKDAAWAYRKAGWIGTIPLPPKSKQLTKKGWTGHEGAMPSGADVAEWIEIEPAGSNIALRMPHGVVGIDVDDYGSKHGAATLDALIEKWGPLPPTWRSTARPGGRSGIYFFRVPHGLWWPGKLGDAIEVVVFQYRYAVVWPSWNPDACAQYQWYPDPEFVYTVDADGSAMRLPHVDELPELPGAWVEGITSGEALTIERKAALPHGGMAKWIDANSHDGECHMMAGDVMQALADFQHGARHDALLSATMRPIRQANGGHRGLRPALAQIRLAFERAAADPTRGSERDDRALEAEWNRAIEGAIGRMLADSLRAPGADVPLCACNEDALSLVGGIIYDGPLTFDPADIPAESLVGSPPQDEPTSFRDRFLSISQLKNLPPPEPLIVDTIERGTIAMIAGDTQTYKSFLVLDWAGCIASGRPWMGRDVPKPSKVLYICAEGANGIYARMDAWQRSRMAELDDFFVMPDPVNMGNRAQMMRLAEDVRDCEIGFVIFDTWNMCTIGIDENAASEVNGVIANLKLIRDATPGGNATVIHHTGRDPGRERGSAAIKQGFDTLYIGEGGNGDAVDYRREKRKDGKREDAFKLGLRLVAGTHSGVLDPIGPGDVPTGRSHAETILRIFIASFMSLGAVTGSKLKEAVGDRVPPSSFWNAVNTLVRSGKLVRSGTPRSPLFSLGKLDPGELQRLTAHDPR